MSLRLRHVSIAIAAAAVAALSLACGAGGPMVRGTSSARAPGLDATAAADLSAFHASDTAALSAALAAQSVATLDADTLWALARCDCAPAAAGLWLKQTVDRPGALPEVLMPDVRAAIRKNPQLQALLGSEVGQIVSTIVLRGDELANQVRGEIWGRVAKAMRIPVQAGKTPKFRLDGFQSAAPGADGTFSLEPQTAVWQLVLAAPELWSLPPGSQGTYADSQAVHLLRLFSEWKYLFGLKETAADESFGGLSFEVARASALGPFDPRDPNAPARIVSGRYTVHYPQVDALTLALRGEERWERATTPVTLKEQAQMWINAATALNRARPKNRGVATELFGEQGLLPDQAYLLPLAYLPGLVALLDGNFLDKEARTIREAAPLPGSPGDDAPAKLASRVRLGEALGRWYQEMSSVDDLALDAGMSAQVTSGLPGLLDALRLTMTLVVKAPELETAPLAEVADALAFVAWAERELLPSDVLREALADKAAHFLEQRVAPLWSRAGTGRLTAGDVLALRHFGNELQATEALPPALASAAAAIKAAADTALTTWGP